MTEAAGPADAADDTAAATTARQQGEDGWQPTEAKEVWKVEIAKLRQRSGTRKQVARTAAVSGATISDAQVPEDQPVAVDFLVEAVGDSVSVTGSVAAQWSSECRRCLDPVTGPIELRVQEMFEPEPTEGETYPLGSETLDLEPMIRDVIMLELPVAPLCREECPGPVPEAFEVVPSDADGEGEDGEPERDPRWAALDGLQLDDG